TASSGGALMRATPTRSSDARAACAARYPISAADIRCSRLIYQDSDGMTCSTVLARAGLQARVAQRALHFRRMNHERGLASRGALQVIDDLQLDRRGRRNLAPCVVQQTLAIGFRERRTRERAQHDPYGRLLHD